MRKFNQRVMTEESYKVMKKTTIKGNVAVRLYMMQRARRFCAYLKHSERGRLKRRAITSANIIQRMFLYLIEDFRLDLANDFPGSTISIGGHEKKQKITLNLAELQNRSKGFSLQSTQDASKWNECLSPGIFRMLHATYFDPEVREECKLPEVSREGLLFKQIALSIHTTAKPQFLHRIRSGAALVSAT